MELGEWIGGRIIENSDNRGSDNRGSTVLPNTKDAVILCLCVASMHICFLNKFIFFIKK